MLSVTKVTFCALKVHFLRYLNSLYHQDYHTALENIHRYFDYRYTYMIYHVVCYISNFLHVCLLDKTCGHLNRFIGLKYP